MNTSPLPSVLRLVLSVAAVLSLGPVVLQAAVTAKTDAGAGAPAGVEAPEAAIPQSVFELPKSSAEGRDPFFPDSSRPFGTAGTRTNPAPGVVKLDLKGLAGQAGTRFATLSTVSPTGTTRSINLAEGQDDDIPTSTGRVKVRCLEIKKESVVLEIGGMRRELRLRTGF